MENQETGIAKIDNFTSIEDMLGLAKALIASKFVPPAYKTPENVVAVILQGKELGFGAMTSLSNINIIQGKPTLSVHAINAKLAQRGIKIKTLKDYEKVVNQDGKVSDIITTIRFYVPLVVPINGDNYLVEDCSFTWKEAISMQLDKKDNWIKMPRIMMWSRCLTIGARRVAADSLLGMYETTEWADVKNARYDVTEEGEVTIIEE
jgi:hypothetical protein